MTDAKSPKKLSLTDAMDSLLDATRERVAKAAQDMNEAKAAPFSAVYEPVYERTDPVNRLWAPLKIALAGPLG